MIHPFGGKMKRLALISAMMFSLSVHAFDLQGHRGARGLAPENTMAAFERALSIGVTTLELDVGLSAEGVPMVSHDPYLAPDMARDASGAWIGSPTPLIRKLSVAELQAFDLGRAREGSPTARNFPLQKAHDGERMPKLADLFERVKSLGADQARFNIETKLDPAKPDDTATPEEFVTALLATINQAGMADRVTIQSFDWRTLKLVQQHAPKIGTAYLTMKTRNTDTAADPAWTAGMRLADHSSVAHMVKAAGGGTWSPNFQTLSETSVKSAQSLGLKVVPWTVNEPGDMQRLIRWGVDGIITDYPDRLRAEMQSAGFVLPATVAIRP